MSNLINFVSNTSTFSITFLYGANIGFGKAFNYKALFIVSFVKHSYYFYIVLDEF